MTTGIAVCGLILSGWVTLSQKIDGPAHDATASQEVTASNITIRGCVQGERKEHFTLVQPSTGAAFDLEGDVDSLQRSSGKLVELKVTELAPTSGHGTKSLPRLVVSELHIIADKCPIQGNGRSAAQGRTYDANQPEPSAETPRYQRSGAPDQTPPPAGTNPNGAGVSGAPSPGTGNPPK